MRRIALLILSFIISLPAFGATIYIPEDYGTIQEGIDASSDGDEVIVSPGTYVENINYCGKLIVVGSLFYTTQDTSYISETIIDGNSNGSVVTFNGEEDSTSVLTGFTIQNGYGYSEGGGVCCDYYSSPRLENLIIKDNTASEGGGICCKLFASAHLKNLIIQDNVAGYGGGIYSHVSNNLELENLRIIGNYSNYDGGAAVFRSSNVFLKDLIIENNECERNGGGIYFFAGSSVLENVTIRNNVSADLGGGILLSESAEIAFSSENRCNIYFNLANIGNYSNDIYSINYITVIVDTFTVINPGNQYTAPVEHFSYDILHGIQEPANADLYVSPTGSNANTGLTESDPLKTILHACAIIDADSLNQHTIHLAEGIYSQLTNGEPFPIILPDYVSLSGIAEDAVILDAEGTESVLSFNDIEGVSISNLTIVNGFSEYGGGINSISASLSLENLTISNNVSTVSGGAINCFSTSLNLDNVRITNNSSEICGGGISLEENSSATIINVSLENNTSISGGGAWVSNDCLFNLENSNLLMNSAENGGGLFCADSSFVLLQDIILSYNTASFSGGGIFCESSNVSLMDVLISNNSSAENGGGIYCVSSNPLFESSDIVSNSSYYGGGVALSNVSSPNLYNILISNNTAYNGGGLFCQNASSPVLSNTLISVNHADNKGGGICCWGNSNIIADRIIIRGNTSVSGGGTYCWDGSNPVFINATFVNNFALSGGSICCYNSSNPVLVNCILWNNLNHEIELVSHSNPCTISIAYSNVLGGEDGIEAGIDNSINWLEGNIDSDPMFANLVTGDLHLTDISPCIDSGTAYFYHDGEVLVDMNDDDYYGISPDMGAYEYGIVSTDECKIENIKCKISNYPNPFNPETTISFFSPEGTESTEISIFNIKGQKVTTLIDDHLDAGNYTVIWNGSDQSSGVYFWVLVLDDKIVSSQKMLLLK